MQREVRHHATADVIFADDETEFLMAMRNYQASTGKKFPTFTDILGVAKSLGYRKPESSHQGFGSTVEMDEALQF